MRDVPMEPVPLSEKKKNTTSEQVHLEQAEQLIWIDERQHLANLRFVQVNQTKP